MWPKMGPGWNWKCFRPSASSRMMLVPHDVGRHQVGRELDAREAQLEAFGQRLDEQRLAEPGRPLEEHVAAREHADQDVIDDVPVPDDDLLDLGAQLLEGRHELLDPGLLSHAISLMRPPAVRAIIKPGRHSVNGRIIGGIHGAEREGAPEPREGISPGPRASAVELVAMREPPDTSDLRCRQIAELLTDFLEGRLPPATRDQIAWHMDACPPCVAFLNTFRSTLKAIRRLPDLPPYPERASPADARRPAWPERPGGPEGRGGVPDSFRDAADGLGAWGGSPIPTVRRGWRVR